MARKRTDWLQLGSGKTYFHRVHRPLQCLIFITPLLLFYQIGAAVLQPQFADSTVSWRVDVVAFILMLRFFELFGAAANVLPLLAVISILICWHLARRDPWDFEPKLYLGMAAESIIWGVPFVIIGLAVSRQPVVQALAATIPSILPWRIEVLLSVGAGIYEELLFRLIAINLLSMILIDIFEMKATWGIPLIILSSAILFSAYHLLGQEPFDAGIFAFRTALGIYLAGIYIYRGFGITVGAHTVYDLIVVAIMHYRR